MKHKLLALLAVGLLAGSQASAAIVTYDFEALGTYSGSFSFDDTNTTTIADPPGMPPEASWYSAISYIVNGEAVESASVGILDNYPFVNIDCIYVVGQAGIGNVVLELCAGDGLWSDEQLSNASALALADFHSANALAGGVQFPLTSLTLRTNPVPAMFDELLADLTALGKSGKSLVNKVTLAQTYYAAGDVQATCAVMTDFVLAVQNMAKGKKPKLPADAAASLISDADAIMTAIGCG